MSAILETSLQGLKNSQKWKGHTEASRSYQREMSKSVSDVRNQEASVLSSIGHSNNPASNKWAYNKIFKVEQNCGKMKNKRESKLKRKLSELQSDRSVQADPSKEFIKAQQPNLSENVYHLQHDKDDEPYMFIFDNEHPNNDFEISRDTNLFKFVDDAYLHKLDNINDKLFMADNELFGLKRQDDLCQLKLFDQQPFSFVCSQVQADPWENKSISEPSSL